MSTISLFSRLDHAACILALPGFEHTLTGMHAGFATNLLAILWLGGTYTHWVTMTNFQKVSPFFPKVSGLTWRELGETGKMSSQTWSRALPLQYSDVHQRTIWNSFYTLNREM